MRRFCRHAFLTTILIALPVVSFAAQPEITNEKMEACMALDSADARNSCYDKLCTFSTACARSLVTKATELKGPKEAMSVLHDLYSRGQRAITGDGHDLAHQIGRTAARESQGGWLAFLECPDDFFLGCRHGFFEAMLGELGSSVEAAVDVCKKAPSSERAFCFHGMGHGIMMSNANDVFKSLEICDELPGRTAARGCYQGVFMENFNASERGEARSGVLDPNDVLAPCTKIDRKYRTECYGQHAGYILKALSGSLITAIQACERAGKSAWTDACISHFGQNMTTYDYQTRYLGSFDADKVPESAKILCDRFPEKHRPMCYQGAVHNFMLYDQPKEAVHFCSLVDLKKCTSIIFPYVQRSIYSPEQRENICLMFSESLDRATCRHPTIVPLLLDLGRVLGIAVVVAALIVLFGWRFIKRPYTRSR